MPTLAVVIGIVTAAAAVHVTAAAIAISVTAIQRGGRRHNAQSATPEDVKFVSTWSPEVTIFPPNTCASAVTYYSRTVSARLPPVHKGFRCVLFPVTPDEG
ncbi:MAG TPA: hypothetical protein VJX66_09290 [Amycolatopsis sp.]|nr:hypothetical protein [Amycolatopsis sp.]